MAAHKKSFGVSKLPHNTGKSTRRVGRRLSGCECPEKECHSIAPALRLDLRRSAEGAVKSVQVQYPRTRTITWPNRSAGPWGSSSRPCLVKAIRRTVIWHPEQINVWCSKPRDSSRVLRGHVRQDQLSITRFAVHCFHSRAIRPAPARSLLMASGPLSKSGCDRTAKWQDNLALPAFARPD